MKTAGEFAQEAALAVSGERERTHGSKLENFTKISRLWNAFLSVRKDPAAPLTAEDVGHMMVLLKMARTQHGAFNEDDYTDLVGYSCCTAEVAVALRQPV